MRQIRDEDSNSLIHLLHSSVIAESEKALLVSCETVDGEEQQIWFPKSVCDVERDIGNVPIGDVYVQIWFLKKVEEEKGEELKTKIY